MLFPPTPDGEPAFVTVSGDKGIYAWPFDLPNGDWTVSTKIENSDPNSEEILVDYFVLVPKEYFEPLILKEDIYESCLAGVTLPYCMQYGYPDVSQHPTALSEQHSQRPGGSLGDVYWLDRQDIADEVGTGGQKMATLARWQPELEFDVDLQEPGKHVLAIAFFTPDEVNGTKTIGVSAKDSFIVDSDAGAGQAYVINCTYSTLCRQVVIDDEGRVAEFDFESNSGKVKLKFMPCLFTKLVMYNEYFRSS